MINAKMTEIEMANLIEEVGRAELFDELRQMEEDTAWHNSTEKWGAVKSRYFKAICVTLIALGYDAQWVNDEFYIELEKTYDYIFKKSYSDLKE